jgi:diadenosine tetraphosphate (Ap4A) HIT family hydrolase
MLRSSDDRFTLDPQLARDTRPVGDLVLCRVLLTNDANYPWLILVPRRTGASEIIDLDSADQAQLTAEIAQVSRVLKDITRCDKINVAALGNVVAQLHVHIIARTRNDAAWPKPVWGVVNAKGYQDSTAERLIRQVQQSLSVTP